MIFYDSLFFFFNHMKNEECQCESGKLICDISQDLYPELFGVPSVKVLAE